MISLQEMKDTNQETGKEDTNQEIDRKDTNNKKIGRGDTNQIIQANC